jgi:hypothetical protein
MSTKVVEAVVMYVSNTSRFSWSFGVRRRCGPPSLLLVIEQSRAIEVGQSRKRGWSAPYPDHSGAPLNRLPSSLLNLAVGAPQPSRGDPSLLVMARIADALSVPLVKLLSE